MVSDVTPLEMEEVHGASVVHLRTFDVDPQGRETHWGWRVHCADCGFLSNVLLDRQYGYVVRDKHKCKEES